LAYGAAALQACRTPLALLPTRSQARRSERGAAPPRESAVLTAAAWLLWIGAFAIALVAPLSSDYATLQLAWGDAADAGAALTAVVAGGIAVGLLGMHLGQLLKARRARHVSTRTRRNRIAVMLFLTLCGGLMYLGLLR
jgi:membrane protein YqaA with SNARE-associated domain